MEFALETTGLTKTFDGLTVLKDVNLQIPRGTIYGVVGANGAGKSTLLRLLHGVIWPSAGEIKVFGSPLPRESAEMRQKIQHVAAEGNIYSSFRVQDLVKFAGQLYDEWDESRCQRLLSALELPRKRLIKHLSFGMRMQLRLVLRLAAHPEILLLDEPTNGLDPVIKRQFLQLILDEAIHDGTTVVIATHQLADLERLADGLAVMYQGKVAATGYIDDLKSNIHAYQVILPNGIPSVISGNSVILYSEHRGSVWTIVAEDKDGRVEKLLAQYSNHVECIPLNLEDIFTYLLLKEGYSREAILLA